MSAMAGRYGSGKPKYTTKELSLENYDYHYHHHHSDHPTLTVPQLNEILHLHGYVMLQKLNLRKGKIVEALSGIDSLMNPRRSTLNEALSSCNTCLTVGEVNADLTALNWQEEFVVESLHPIPFTTNNTDVHDIHTSSLTDKRRNKRAMKAKERKVFDALHPTKPRSKKNFIKRKHLSDIYYRL